MQPGGPRRAFGQVRHNDATPSSPAQFYRRFLVLIEPVSSWCLNPRALNTNWEQKLSIQFGRQGGVTHQQLSGESKMRFVSTALVMMAIALMLLALMLLTPGA
jgi:hypothetical protein